jgi:hypothetical protein
LCAPSGLNCTANLVPITDSKRVSTETNPLRDQTAASESSTVIATAALTVNEEITSTQTVEIPSVDKLLPLIETTKPASLPEVLTREYLWDKFTWAATDAAASVLFEKYLPEDFINVIPTIVKSISGYRYLRCGIEITVKINPVAFQSGLLAVTLWPNFSLAGLTTPGKNSFFSHLHGGPTLISASSGNSITLKCPWQC